MAIAARIALVAFSRARSAWEAARRSRPLGHRALAEQARQQGRPDPAAWTAAATEWERLGQPYRAAYAGYRHAEVLLAADDRDPAAVALGHAAAITGRLGAPSTARSRRWRGAPAWIWPHLLPLRPRRSACRPRRRSWA